MNKNGVIFQNQFYDTENGQALSSAIKTEHFTVLQVADSHYLSDFDIHSHEQPCDLEITFVVHGSLVCSTDGVMQRVEKNEAYLSFDGEKHGLEAKNSVRFQTLAVNVEQGSEASTIVSLLKKEHARKDMRTRKSHGLSSAFSSIVGEFSKEKPFRKAYLDSLIFTVLVLLAREEESSPAAPLPKEILPDMMQYIDEHFLSITSLFELSAKFGYSYNYLCSVFKKLHGTTVREYLNRKKYEYAKELLKKGISVTEISEILGYSSPYNFSRAFKAICGVSPVRYKTKK